jgi:dienelactone hydrolase
MPVRCATGNSFRCLGRFQTDSRRSRIARLSGRGTGLGLVLVCLWCARITPACAAEIKKTTDHFPIVVAKSIEVERFEPAVPGTYPAIVMLHGSDGLTKCGIYYRAGAQILAQAGYVVFLVHYFDRTDIKEIAPCDIKEPQFLDWMETVRAAVMYAAKQTGVDKNRIGLLGFSLGACLALAVAGQGDVQIAAVADWFGGYPEELRKKCKRLPPTLIIHGDADKTVPVQEAYALEALLKDKQAPCESKIYTKQGHLFQDQPFGKDFCDARQRTLAFLAKHLKRSLISATGK